MKIKKWEEKNRNINRHADQTKVKIMKMIHSTRNKLKLGGFFSKSLGGRSPSRDSGLDAMNATDN